MSPLGLLLTMPSSYASGHGKYSTSSPKQCGQFSVRVISAKTVPIRGNVVFVMPGYVIFAIASVIGVDLCIASSICHPISIGVPIALIRAMFMPLVGAPDHIPFHPMMWLSGDRLVVERLTRRPCDEWPRWIYTNEKTGTLSTQIHSQTSRQPRIGYLSRIHMT